MQFINKNLIGALAVSVWLLTAGTAHAAGTITGAAAGGSGGGAATIADGADVNQGATTDAAATAGAAGTISAKLRLLTTQLNNIQTSIQLLDDAIHASDAALSKVLAIGCQFDDTTPGTTTEDGVRAVRCSPRRELYGQIRDAAGNERGANVNASNELLTNANTELPAPVQLANGLSLPITSLVGAVNLFHNGSTLDLGKAATAGAGNTDATTARVVLSTDQTVADPCTFRAKTVVSISISTATTTQLVAASASNKFYVCALNLITAAANNVALVEDDTAACATPTAGMAGGTTAASGWNFAANGGLTLGNGSGTVMGSASTNRYVCLITSAATQLSGAMSYVLAP